MLATFGKTSVLTTFRTVNMRLIALVEPRVVKQTSDKVQGCVVRSIDNTFSDTMFQVEVKGTGGHVDLMWVPMSKINALLEITKKEE